MGRETVTLLAMAADMDDVEQIMDSISKMVAPPEAEAERRATYEFATARRIKIARGQN